jgi:hypothetical protein
MGVCAQTSFEIQTKDKETSQKVVEILKNLTAQDPDGNEYGENIEATDEFITGFMGSGRIQNLEYRCQKIWDAIKDIDGVIEINCPFMVEGDGFYQNKEE